MRRMAMAGATRLEQGGQALLEMDAPVPVQVDFAAARVEVLLPELFTGQLRVRAPLAHAVTLNGAPAEFRAEGEYLVIRVRGAG